MQNTKADKSKTSVFPGLPTLSITLILRFIFFAFIAFLILYPISMLIIGSFRTEMPGLPGSWGLRGWRELFNDPGTIRAVKNTILIAVFKTLVGIPFAILFCWLINRTNMPGRKILDTILHLNFFIVPALPVLLGWTILLDPRSGIINTSWNNAFGHILFNLNSVPGVIFVLLSTNISFYYMFLAPAFKNMDNTMEEAARVSGASGLSTMRRIVLPLLKPAILAILIMSFITGIEVFEASLLLGVDTIATQIFHLTNRMGNYMAAMSLAIVLIVVTSALVLIQRQALGNKQRTTITGKGFHPRPMNLGKWRWPALSIMIIFLGILAVPPLVMFIMTTFMKYPGVFNLPGGSWTLRNFSELFKMYPDTWQVIKNTIILALAAPTLTVIFCTLLAYISVKTKFRERKVLDFIAWIPWGIPGIALSMA
ncbi:MAG: iron ABC transporter permease, partial [Chloroflexi bacterium]|nr:iron ABC transporter permease [Chloroflexota bacterium]